MHRPAFTLVEFLVVMVIVVILAALTFPGFHLARAKARQSSCANNQRQIALAVLAFAQDHEECFPIARDFWTSLNLDPKLLICPSDNRTETNSYVCNNIICGTRMATFRNHQDTMVTADGMSNPVAATDTVSNIAYSSQNLDKRHQGKFVASFLDGHVEVRQKCPTLYQLPQWEHLMLWVNADNGVRLKTFTLTVTAWTDQSTHHFTLTPLYADRPPTYVESVPALGGNSALQFEPPVGQAGTLISSDVSGVWEREEGTIILVYCPTAHSQAEYTVLDQSNGAAVQATRLKLPNPNQSAMEHALTAGANTSSPNTPSVTLTANPPTINPGQSTTLSWASTYADAVESSTFGAAALTGTTVVSPSVTTTYSITVVQGNKKATTSATVTVDSSAKFVGAISWFRSDATAQYPPDSLPYNTPMCLTLVSGSNSYTAYHNGVPWPPYPGGVHWLTPSQFYLGGSPHGNSNSITSYRGYIAEVIVYNKALPDADRRGIEQYLMTKYRL